MSIRTVNTYTIEDHPQPEKVYEWIRENWHDLAEHHVSELIDSLKAFTQEFNLELDYSISAVPDRGEYIRLTGQVSMQQVSEMLDTEKYLTGVCYDMAILAAIDTQQSLNIASDLLKTIHDETEYLYSRESLLEHCEDNGYYFFLDGSFAP